MKCPKCGYLGFETTDRCRNCQYDFSLAPFVSESELALHSAEHQRESVTDFEMPPMGPQIDSATALDLDRLFGNPEPAVPSPPSPTGPSRVGRAGEPSAIEVLGFEGGPELESGKEPQLMDSAALSDMAMTIETAASAHEGALPFDDAPLVPPPAARMPLAVRRSTPEFQRNRPRTTRRARTDSLDLESASLRPSVASQATTDIVPLPMEMPSLGARAGAGLIDLVLLVGIDSAVLYLTLRIVGLQNTLEDLRVLPAIPFVGFLAILAFGYVSAFTVAGGQSIGKMVFNLRVIGDDGRPVDARGGMLRALGCMLVPVSLGLSYLPVLFSSDHRALHDRLAGTRVVQE